MLNFALVGCGRIAKRHSELLGNGIIKGAKLIAVCDHQQNKAKVIAERFKINAYQDMHDMAKKEKIDVFVILTESGNHAKNVIELAKYKKHIVVEKPMALKLSDANDMIKICEKNKIRLCVIKQNRFNLPIVKLREALDGKRFGKIFLGTVRVRWSRNQEYYDQDNWRGKWLMDGGVLTNQASHHIDLLEWMMGDVKSVHAMSINALADIEAEDTAIVNIRFKSGALGIIEATTSIRPTDLEGSISIFGEKGSVEIGGFAVNEIKTWNFIDKTESDKEVFKKYSVNPPNVYGFGHQEYYQNLVDSINSNTLHHVDGEEGRKSVKLINAIYESIETKKEILLSEASGKSRLGF